MSEQPLSDFYATRLADGRYLLGRVRNGALYWGFIKLAELRHLFPGTDDFESLRVNAVYRGAVSELVLDHSWEC